MRILQIINSLGTGGAEKLILDTLPLYQAKGVSVDVLLLWDNDCMFTKALQKTNCCTIYVLKKSTTYKDIYSISHIFKIAKILKNYDLAHVHLFPAQYFVVFANILIGNTCELVFTEHNTSNSRIKNKLFKPIERFIYKRYSKIICISEEIKSIYSKYISNGKDQLVVIQNGVNIENILNAVPYDKKSLVSDFSEDTILLLQISAFRLQKDQLTLIKALKLLPENFKLILIGEGETKKKCEEYVSKEGLAKNVFFFGQRNDIPRLLQSVDLVILSSHYEGLSLSSIEGLASGVPFVASDVPGLHEIVKDYGVLFEKENESDLASKINQLLDDKDYYLQTSKSCVERAKHFDIEIMINKHIALYQEVYEA